MTMGEKWLNEVRTIRYIAALPIGIFPGEKGKPLSGRYKAPFHEKITISTT